LDSKNTIFAFSAVFGSTRSKGFSICIEVINDIGQRIYYKERYKCKVGSDHVWLNVDVPDHSQLKTDNLRVIFKCYNKHIDNCSSQPVFFFRSCGFHLQHIHIDEEEAINDDIQIVETP
jgi:hypothetical protein